MLYLDSGNAVIARDLDVLRGSIDGVRVETRVLVREAVKKRAAGVILAHNHPSGDPTPSDTDIAVTATVQDALEIVDITLLDHIVVGNGDCRSLRKAGHL